MIASPFSLTPDIDEVILQALVQVLTAELQTAVPTTDPLWLRTIKVTPLQDDPTLTAPYLTVGPDFEKGIELIEGHLTKIYGEAEIGGPIRYLYHYRITCGTPITTTRESCTLQIGNLASRIARVLMDHYDLADILGAGLLMSEDYTKYIEGANRRLITTIQRRLKGGEQTWFGEATILFRYPVSWE